MGAGALGPEVDVVELEQRAELLGAAPVGVGDEDGAADARAAGEGEGGEEGRLDGEEDVQPPHPVEEVGPGWDGELGQVAGRGVLVDGVGGVSSVGDDPGLYELVKRRVEDGDAHPRARSPAKRLGREGWRVLIIRNYTYEKKVWKG